MDKKIKATLDRRACINQILAKRGDALAQFSLGASYERGQVRAHTHARTSRVHTHTHARTRIRVLTHAHNRTHAHM